MTRDERYAGLKARGLTVEQLAAARGWVYVEATRVMRLGAGGIGAPGSRTREYAEGIAEALGRPYAEVWGEERGGEQAA